MVWRISRRNSIIKWQGYRVSASRLAESNFRYTQARVGTVPGFSACEITRHRRSDREERDDQAGSLRHLHPRVDFFGIRWTVAQIRPWILDTVELFGPDRCMFASHLPICKLACSVQQLYAAYLEVIADFSVSEKRQMLHDTAAEIYGL